MAQNASAERQSPDEDRGIQNAEMRLKKQRLDSLTPEQIREQTQRNKETTRAENDSANDPMYEPRNSEPKYKYDKNDTKKIYPKIRDILKGEGVDVDATDIKDLGSLEATSLPKPSFPYTIFLIGVIKDLIDFADLTLLGIVVTTTFSFVIALILFFWFWGKMSFSGTKAKIVAGLWRKMVTTKIWQRYAIAMGIEFVPFLKLIPATTILILLVHNSEKKVAKLVNLMLDELVKGRRR